MAETMALSMLMFTGASQFAFVGLVGSGAAAAATAVLLGARNAFYGVSLVPILRVRGLRRWATAHLVIDESTAMALGQPTPELGRLGFYAGGVAVFVCGTLATVVGALGAQVLSDPRVSASTRRAPAAFLALLAPRLRGQGREPWAVALAGAPSPWPSRRSCPPACPCSPPPAWPSWPRWAGRAAPADDGDEPDAVKDER